MKHFLSQLKIKKYISQLLATIIPHYFNVLQYLVTYFIYPFILRLCISNGTIKNLKQMQTYQFYFLHIS